MVSLIQWHYTLLNLNTAKTDFLKINLQPADRLNVNEAALIGYFNANDIV